MTVTIPSPAPAVVVLGDRAYVGFPEFFDPERTAPAALFDITEYTAKRVAAQRLRITSVSWERDAGGRVRALMITAHSSLPDLDALGDAPVRVNHGAEADLISLAPALDGTVIVARVRPDALPARPWPVGLRVAALGVTTEAVLPPGLTLPGTGFRRGLRRYEACGATDPLGRLVVLTRRMRLLGTR